MNRNLTNGIIAIEVAEHGAEMRSLTREGRQYLWTGDAQFWGRCAPILFPAVGKPFQDEIRVDGTVYPLKQHGFARDSEFKVLAEGKNSIRLQMVESGRSQAYPYRLGLEVCYRLEGLTVTAEWTVKNRDDKEAFFQIGAHPGFLLPDFDSESAVNGYVRLYDKNGKLVAPVLYSDLEDGNRIPKDHKVMLLRETPLMGRTFIHDALIIEKGQVTKVELWDRHCDLVLTVDCPQAEAFGIWAPYKEGCPFVCLEPWCGLTDPKGFTGDISAREYIHSLAPGGTYTFTYTIELAQ